MHLRAHAPPAAELAPRDRDFWLRLWVRTAARGAVIVLAYFAAWELVERALVARGATDLHVLHLLRGTTAAFLLATWSFLRVRRQRVATDDALHVRMSTLEAQLRHQEKMASLGVLAAGFAHDLGNPLASLGTELEMLEGEADVAHIRASLDVLRRHVARMNRTLREMVDFARRRRDELTDVSLALAVEDSARLVRHDPRWRMVALTIDVPPDVPSVRMVEDHLVLVLVNLMLNAADAMPRGGELRVTARAEGDRVELRVKDTGVGMSADVLARAGAPMFTTKSHGRGTGLGLSVSSDIVSAAGGALRIASAPGEGTEVTIELPASRMSDG